MNRDLHDVQRLVLKIGTSTLSRQTDWQAVSEGARPSGSIDSEFLHDIARQVALVMREGKQVLLVTSGAIGMGAHELCLEKRPTEIEVRQACAAIGQPILMEEYRRVFGIYGITIAQILITRDDWDNRQSYLNLRNAVETLLSFKILPVFNENDTVSTAEIGNAFGDNDQLSAYVASKVDAELLIILTDVDALYDANPKENQYAKPVRYVEAITPEIREMASGKGSEFSTGGMLTKLAAVEIAGDAGCRVVLAHGREPTLINRILSGEEVGTLFGANHPLRNRTRWIKQARAHGSIQIDSGALKALKTHHSLLPSGVTTVLGDFKRGDVILVNDSIKLISGYSSAELEAIKGKHSSELEAILGEHAVLIVARPEDMAFL